MIFILASTLAGWARLEGTEGALEMFNVYRFPLDFPEHYVVRRSFVRSDGVIVSDIVPRLASDLAGARALVPPGLYRQPRHDSDPPQIVEVWF